MLDILDSREFMFLVGFKAALYQTQLALGVKKTHPALAPLYNKVNKLMSDLIAGRV